MNFLKRKPIILSCYTVGYRPLYGCLLEKYIKKIRAGHSETMVKTGLYAFLFINRFLKFILNKGGTQLFRNLSRPVARKNSP